MATYWYFKEQEDERGPMTSRALRRLAVEGAIDEETLVRKGKSGRWVPARRVKGLLVRSRLVEEDDFHRYIPSNPAPLPESDDGASHGVDAAAEDDLEEPEWEVVEENHDQEDREATSTESAVPPPIPTTDQPPTAAEKRYPSLRLIASITKLGSILLLVIGLVWFIGGIAACLQVSTEGLSAAQALLVNIGAPMLLVVTTVFMFGLPALLLFAAADAIAVILDIEENTRMTHLAATRETEPELE